jgi:hypothetical protein
MTDRSDLILFNNPMFILHRMSKIRTIWRILVEKHGTNDRLSAKVETSTASPLDEDGAIEPINNSTLYKEKVHETSDGFLSSLLRSS